LYLTGSSGGGSASWQLGSSLSEGEGPWRLCCAACCAALRCGVVCCWGALPCAVYPHDTHQTLTPNLNHTNPNLTILQTSFKLYVAEVFSEKADLLLRRLSAACPSISVTRVTPPGDAGITGVTPSVQGVTEGAPIDLHDLMYRFTLDTFARIGGCMG